MIRLMPSEIEFPADYVANDEEVLLIAESIREQGLLHKPAVRQVNGKYEVVIGMKRVDAMRRMGVEIEVDLLENISDVEAKIMRVHENLKRYNLPWPEQVELTETLHKLRQEQEGIGSATAGPKKTGWSMRDTARELGVALGRVSEDVMLAEAVRLDPNLRGIKDKKTAIKLARRAARRIEQEEEAELDVEFEVNKVFTGDSSTILDYFPGNAFDCCITDPPWIDFKFEGLTKDTDTAKVFNSLWRVMKWNSFLYVFVGIDDFYFYRTYLGEIGWEVQKLPCIWSKPGVLTRGSKMWEYGRDLEFILVAVKGSPALTVSTQVSSIFTFPPIPPQKLVHPNEKPVELIKSILYHSTFDKSIIVDPFAGSGATGEACIETGRRFILIERDQIFSKKIGSRIETCFKRKENG